MKKAYKYTLTALLCILTAILLLFSGCSRKIPPEFMPEAGTDEAIYQTAVYYANEGRHYDAYQNFYAIRGYLDAAEQADHNLRQYMLWALDKGIYEEVYFAARQMDHNDQTNRELIISCVEQMIATGEEESMDYAEYILNMIGESQLTEELKELHLTAMYSEQLQEGIRLYRAGRYYEALDVLLDISGDYLPSDERELHNVYYEMSFFHTQNTRSEPSRSSLFLSSYDIEEFSSLMTMLHECVDNPEFAAYREDITKALAHPAFDLVRFFGGNWQCGEYYLTTCFDPTGENGAAIEHNLPKDYFPEIDCYYIDSENSCVCFCNKNNTEIFCLLGFSEDIPNPEEMYILDSENSRLTFTPCDSPATSAADA